MHSQGEAVVVLLLRPPAEKEKEEEREKEKEEVVEVEGARGVAREAAAEGEATMRSWRSAETKVALRQVLVAQQECEREREWGREGERQAPPSVAVAAVDEAMADIWQRQAAIEAAQAASAPAVLDYMATSPRHNVMMGVVASEVQQAARAVDVEMDAVVAAEAVEVCVCVCDRETETETERERVCVCV